MSGSSGEWRAHGAPILREVLHAVRRPTWRLVIDWVLTTAGIGIAVWRLAPTLAAVGDLGARLTGLRWTWLAVAVPAAVASLVVYGELHRHLLLAGGAKLKFGTVQAVNFIGNAIAQTVPSAGATAGIAYSVAAFRMRGVDTGLSLWASLLAALISGVALVVLGPLVAAFDGLLPRTAAAALSGALAVLSVTAWLLVRRRRSLHGIAHLTTAIARHIPVLKNAKWVSGGPGRADAVSDRIALLRPGFGQWAWFFGIALLSWALDYVALAACVAAAANTVPWAALAAGYLAVQGSIGLQLTPAGAGPAEAGLLAALVAGGLLDTTAAVAVVLFRAITWPMLTSAGWVVFLVTSRRRSPSGNPLRQHFSARRRWGRRDYTEK